MCLVAGFAVGADGSVAHEGAQSQRFEKLLNPFAEPPPHGAVAFPSPKAITLSAEVSNDEKSNPRKKKKKKKEKKKKKSVVVRSKDGKPPPLPAQKVETGEIPLLSAMEAQVQWIQDTVRKKVRECTAQANGVRASLMECLRIVNDRRKTPRSVEKVVYDENEVGPDGLSIDGMELSQSTSSSATLAFSDGEDDWETVTRGAGNTRLPIEASGISTYGIDEGAPNPPAAKPFGDILPAEEFSGISNEAKEPEKVDPMAKWVALRAAESRHKLPPKILRLLDDPQLADQQLKEAKQVEDKRIQRESDAHKVGGKSKLKAKTAKKKARSTAPQKECCPEPLITPSAEAASPGSVAVSEADVSSLCLNLEPITTAQQPLWDESDVGAVANYYECEWPPVTAEELEGQWEVVETKKMKKRKHQEGISVDAMHAGTKNMSSRAKEHALASSNGLEALLVGSSSGDKNPTSCEIPPSRADRPKQTETLEKLPSLPGTADLSGDGGSNVAAVKSEIEYPAMRVDATSDLDEPPATTTTTPKVEPALPMFGRDVVEAFGSKDVATQPFPAIPEISAEEVSPLNFHVPGGVLIWFS